MNIVHETTIEIGQEQDMVLARQLVRKTTTDLKFSIIDQTKMVTAASELARNTLVHGKGGKMVCQVLDDGIRSGLRLTFEDKGPGIPDLPRALTDGWTTGKGLGMGLSGSKRLVEDFLIETEVGKGTRVTIGRWGGR